MATIIGALPVNLVNGTTADAVQVMADFNWIFSQVNTNGMARANNLSDVLSAATSRTNLGLGAVAVLTQSGLIGFRPFGSVGSTVYTPTAGTVRILAQLQGAGGGSSGCGATSGSQNSLGSAGGGGAWAELYITSGFSGQSIVIGAGGTAGAAGANAGGNGGDTTFMGLTAGGGAGGVGTFAGGATAGAVLTPGALGGTYSGQNVGKIGEPGSLSVSAGLFCSGGTGGACFWGAGGIGGFTIGAKASGGTGRNLGGGAGAPANSASQTATGGSAGAQGFAVIWEFSQ